MLAADFILAISPVFGILVSTLLTLVVIPVLYCTVRRTVDQANFQSAA